MDPRIREQADVIADHCVDLSAGDTVVFDAAPEADELVVALFERAADVGAHPFLIRDRTGERFRRAFLRNHAGEFSEPRHVRGLFDELDVHVTIRSGDNVAALADVDSKTAAAYDRAHEGLREIRLAARWCLTQFPTPSFAQRAGMSTEAYENFVWDATNRDWEAQRLHQRQLVDLLETTDEVRLVSGDETDLRLSVDGMTVINDAAGHNLPGGEVFTAPLPDSVEGTVRFDLPALLRGREVEDVLLRFEGGEVVEHDASQHRDVLTDVLETDDGARRLGELGIGMNRSIDRFTRNMLFDEKMGDTVHLAVGMAYADTVPENRERNESAIHEDMIVDMSEESRIEFDGEVVQRNGTFLFEEGFDG